MVTNRSKQREVTSHNIQESRNILFHAYFLPFRIIAIRTELLYRSERMFRNVEIIVIIIIVTRVPFGHRIFTQ